MNDSRLKLMPIGYSHHGSGGLAHVQQSRRAVYLNSAEAPPKLHLHPRILPVFAADHFADYPIFKIWIILLHEKFCFQIHFSGGRIISRAC
jgi:hypothetical protein